jgi:tRNA U34 5-methylaminomethyl-2-thiouridine-forming methyltransferase MnmC
MADQKDIQDTEIIDGTLGSYQWQETEDGSLTLFSTYFNEACHSHAGATEETLYNYIEGTEVTTRLKQYQSKKEHFTIFEVGFGTGLGLKTTLEAVKDTYNLHFISCELDRKLTEKRLQSLQLEGLLANFEWDDSKELFHAKDHYGAQITILVGDIRKGLPRFIQQNPDLKVNSIYQDAFSPKRNPLLWTKQWFALLGFIASEDCILSTYSSTKAMWKSLIETEWRVCEVKGYGQKKISTRAYRIGESSALVLEQCQRSPTPALCDSLVL